MKKILLLFIILIFAAPAWATQWVCFDEETKSVTGRIQDASEEEPPAYCIEAVESEWELSESSLARVEKDYPIGERVVHVTTNSSDKPSSSRD